MAPLDGLAPRRRSAASCSSKKRVAEVVGGGEVGHDARRARRRGVARRPRRPRACALAASRVPSRPMPVSSLTCTRAACRARGELGELRHGSPRSRRRRRRRQRAPRSSSRAAQRAHHEHGASSRPLVDAAPAPRRRWRPPASSRPPASAARARSATAPCP